MDLGKFVWTLQRQALFFARADCLGDPYEGVYTRAEATALTSMLQALSVPGVRDALPELQRQMPELKRQVLQHIFSSRNEYYVSCWHLNGGESAAMWKIYTSLKDAICITTTYAELQNVPPEECLYGMVNYIDYDREHIPTGNVIRYIATKRLSYKHENEVRGVMWSIQEQVRRDYTLEGNGMIVPVDLHQIIKSVYISPNASPMLTDVVRGLLRTYGLAADVIQSGVNNAPDYLI